MRDRTPHHQQGYYALEAEGDTAAYPEIKARHIVGGFGGVSRSCTTNTEIDVDIKPQLRVLLIAQVCLGSSLAGVVPYR
jgi:hypothetical protein